MSEHYTVTLPDIGEGVVEGEVIEWLKQVGDLLEQDEAVVTVMTDKATVELPAPYPGKLSKQHYAVGEIAIKDLPLYEIELDGALVIPKPVMAATAELSTKFEKKQKAALSCPKTSSGTRSLATPPTRHLAKQIGVDINRISGTGHDGRVTTQDIRESLTQTSLRPPSKTAAPPIIQSTPITRFEDDEETPMFGVRKLVAERTVESTYIIPHFTYCDKIDATRLVQLRTNMKKEAVKQGVKLTYMPFFIRALSMALEKFPIFNSSVDLYKNTIVTHKPHNICIIVKTAQGAISPVLKNVNKLSFHDLIRNYHTLIEEARSGKLPPSAMKDSTFSLTNFGTLGGLWATPVINYPEVAILGVGKMQKEPVVRRGEVVVRDIIYPSWSFDHRIVDGDVVAEFSNLFTTLIENPSRLL